MVSGVTSQIGLWIPFGLSVLLVLAVVTLSQHAIKQTLVRPIGELDLQAAVFHFCELIADSSLRIELANR